MELTNTNVRYLLTIYHLSQARLEVSSKDIAQTLDVSRASVTSMMSILTDKRLVTKERYGKVHLTDDGCRWARVLASQTDKLAETLQNRMELSYEGMKLQQDARVTLQNMKEDAQDLCAEAKQKAAQETAEEA